MNKNGNTIEDTEGQAEKIMARLKHLSTDEMSRALLKKLGDAGLDPVRRRTSIEEVLKSVTPAIVKIVLKDGSSRTGFLIHEAGYVLTNHHKGFGVPKLKEDANTMSVVTYDNRKYSGHVVASSDSRDLALIKIESDREDWPTLTFSKDSEKELDNTAVLALGYTMERPSRRNKRNSFGSGAHRRGSGRRLRQSGKFGGPLIDLSGKVIGVNTGTMSSGRIYLGCNGRLGFAISAPDAEEFLKSVVGLAKAQMSSA